MKKSWGFTAISDLHWDLTPKGSSFQDVSSRYHELMTWHQATTLEAEHQNDAQRGAISAIFLLAGPWSEKPGAVRDSFVKTYFYLLICSQINIDVISLSKVIIHCLVFRGCEFMSTLILIFHWAWSLLDHTGIGYNPTYNLISKIWEVSQDSTGLTKRQRLTNIRKRHVISQEPT